ncbi:hypothetical protein [Aestuariimicrobium kwangyangense]|uniref:hypothetical protein n=1 Tax=Aestuariimicrobium kwangyangense TaxID=396389 RepID=UPI00146CDF5D|nr:hypothetical protein [Aestuariimicrobium kwangyangense]
MERNRVRSWVRVGAAAAAGVALLGACSSQPSVAMKVGDNQISVRQVDDAADACASAFPNDPIGDIRSVVANGLYGAALSDVLSASGTTVADADVNASLDSLGAKNLDPECRNTLKGVLQARMLVEKLGAEKTASLLQHVDITVNPAIGDVNSSRTEIQATSGSLSSLGRVFGQPTGQ